MAVTRAHVSFFGTAADKRDLIIAVLGSWVLTELYSRIAKSMETPTSYLEYCSLVFSFACVWLSRKENVFSMHTGIVSSVYMGIFLLRVELVGQGWLQFAYYVPIQLYGWWIWCRGGSDKTELPVSRLKTAGWFGYGAVFLLIWLASRVTFGFIYDDPRLVWWDTSIVAASIVAQSLMTMKKIESWLVWMFPVNVSSIFLYIHTDLPAFALMYTLFLLNAAWGWSDWFRTFRTENA